MRIESAKYFVRVSHSAEYDEYIIRLYDKRNMKLCLGSYHTDDREDAQQTALCMLSEAEEKQITQPMAVEFDDIPY